MLDSFVQGLELAVEIFPLDLQRSIVFSRHYLENSVHKPLSILQYRPTLTFLKFNHVTIFYQFIGEYLELKIKKSIEKLDLIVNWAIPENIHTPPMDDIGNPVENA